MLRLPMDRRNRLMKLIIPAAGWISICMFAFLYTFKPATYFLVLRLIMLIPFSHPFVDWEWLPSAVECWAKGVDVYVNNTCYTAIEGGRFNYSPLWLRATFLPPGPGWVMPVGIGIAMAFFASLGTLPLPRGRWAWLLTLMATFSSLTVFAVERGNADLILFVIVVVGVKFWSGGPPARLIGYLCFLLAGLLKFYPLVLVLLVFRERVIAFILALVGFGAAVALFIYLFWEELIRVKASIPHGSYFGDMFGAINLPNGLVALGVMRLLPHSALPASADWWGPVLITVLLVTAAVGQATWLVRWGGVRESLAALSVQNRGFLVAGSALIVGCFFAGQSIGYRGVYLLLALPGLLELSRALSNPIACRVAQLSCCAVVLVMWVISIQAFFILVGLSPSRGVESSDVRKVHWLVHELAWWWLIAMLAAVLLAFVLNSPSWSWAMSVRRHATLGLRKL